MALLSKQQILEAQDLKTEDIEVPEWGGTVRAQMLTGAQRDAWEMDMFGSDGGTRNMDNARAKLIARCLIDEQGNPLFIKSEIDALGRKSAAALDRVFDACKRLNRIGAQDMDELVGNSNTSPNADSTSA